MTLKEIKGVQMAGQVFECTGLLKNQHIINKYMVKFSFIKKQFGDDLRYNVAFFKTKFKSELYYFLPESVFLTDNSNSFGEKICILGSDLYEHT